MGRYPRTVSEFASNLREVRVHCSDCGRQRAVPADVLDAAFGPDFDLYDGYAGLEAELRCDQFRRHVACRALQIAALVVGNSSGKTEIAQLYAPQPIDHQIRRLDVSVDNIAGMQHGQGLE